MNYLKAPSVARLTPIIRGQPNAVSKGAFIVVHTLAFRLPDRPERVNLYKMPKKWIRTKEWERQPHAKGRIASLWWFDFPDRQVVISAYIEQARRGRAVPDDFKPKLVDWLDELWKSQNKREWGQPRTYRYWTIPSFARAHGLKPATLMKRVRELEEIARHKFPDRVPSSRKKRAPLSEQEIQEIKARYLSGVDAKELAAEYRIPASQVGHICRDEKEIRRSERETQESQQSAANGAESQPEPDPIEEMF